MGTLVLENFIVKKGNFLLQIDQLSLKGSQMVAICGPNGSGKSTFLSALAGLLPYKGKYFLFNTDFSKIEFNKRYQLIGYLPQETKHFLPFDVFYTVLTGRFPILKKKSYSREDIKETEKILKIFGLWKLKNRDFSQLSGGEKKRVLLARIFNRNPQILLLDEPFNQLDLYYQLQLISLFKKFSNLTVLAVIHDVQLAIRYFQKIMFLKNGISIFFDTPQKLTDEFVSETLNIPIKFIKIPDEHSSYFYLLK